MLFKYYIGACVVSQCGKGSLPMATAQYKNKATVHAHRHAVVPCKPPLSSASCKVGGSSQADRLKRNTAMDDSNGGS